MTVTSDYTHLLDHPHLIAEMDKEVFHNWVNAYPHVPIYRVLLAAKYQIENRDEVEKYIREAAFYVQDRKQFKRLLRLWQEEMTAESEKTDTVIAVEREEESDLKETVENATEVSQSLETEKIESISNVNEIEATVKEEPTVETITQEEEKIELSSPETIESKTNLSVSDEVISTQKVEIVNTDIDWLLPWIEDFDVDFSATTTNIEVQESEVSSETVAKQAPNEVTQEKEESEDKEEQISIEKIHTVKNQEEHVSKDGSHSFDEWLNILEQKKRGDEDAPIFELPIPNILKDEEKVVADKESPHKKSETIEIDEQTVKKIANESISFKEDMVTETLAKLYEIQGKKEQAIYIYQQLIEKYPKKSTYFASKIKKIK